MEFLGPAIRVILFTISVCIVADNAVFATVKRCRRNDSDTRFIRNGYEGLLIRIGEEVSEDYSFISDLTQLLTSTSKSLFRATKQRAYIRQVNILVPRLWGDPPLHMANITKFATRVYSSLEGDIKIKHRSVKSEDEAVFWEPGDNQAYVDPPYVIKPTPCGYSGRYLRMTPEYIRFGNRQEAIDIYGEQDKVLLRQWAKLRWGVYDEVPVDGLESNFYRHSNLQINPISCSQNIPGERINSDDLTRSCSSEEALRNEKCVFKPTGLLNSGKTFASIMYRTDREYIQHFCDSGDSPLPPERQHNAEAPTVHNLHCQGKSIWDIMRDHPDFAQGSDQPFANGFIVPPVQINIIRNPVRRIVMVLDTSTSMSRFNRLSLLRQAASQFIDTVPDRSWVGIVAFSAQARVLVKLLEITSDKDRATLKNGLPKSPFLGTSIGNGIKKGLKLLRESSQHKFGSRGTLLVLSDGKEHNGPKIADVMSQVKNSGVTINTIALGNKAPTDLETLAAVTGGSSYFASSGDFADKSELRAAFLATIENEDDDTIVVSSVTLRIPPNSTIQHHFIIDETIGNKARITLLYTDSVAPTIGLKDPEERIVWEDSSNSSDRNVVFSWDEEFSTKIIQYSSEMKPGVWCVMLKNRRLGSPTTIHITVFSRPVDNNGGLVLSPALLCRQINFTGNENIVVYAHLSLGEFAVLDAEVQAAVTRPLTLSGTYDTSTLPLKDDGRGADVVANDGVYSGYFTSFTLRGRYNVKVNASSTGLARIHPKYILGIGRLRKPSITISTGNESTGSLPAEKGKSRRRRAIKFGFLKPFSRGSTQQKEFVVEKSQAVVCPTGYKHFQDSCYKRVRLPPKAAKEAAEYCESENGYLARANSQQEYNYLLENMQSGETWFGGVDKSLTIDGNILTYRIKRDADDDLVALAKVFSAESLSEELRRAIESFEPDWDGLSRKEINSIIRRLGISSESEIESLKEVKLKSWQPYHTDPSYTRRQKRKSDDTSQNDEIVNEDSRTVTTTTEMYRNITLALAKKGPEGVEFYASGEEEQKCSWISRDKLYETTGILCQRRHSFFCERPKKDLIAPSRINDFRLTQQQNNTQIIKFRWTAPGDDSTFGTAERYEIRALRTSKARILEENFEIGEEILPASIMQGSLSTPKPSGEKEELTLNRSEVSDCPPHAAVDTIIFLPRRLFEPKQSLPTEREGINQFLTNLTDTFKISEYEIQVTIVAFERDRGHIMLRDSGDKTEIIRTLANDNKIPDGNITDILNELLTSGRVAFPKQAIMILSNEDMGSIEIIKASMHLINTVVLGVAVSKESMIKSIVREPVCENAIFASSWGEITSSVMKISQQICNARSDEYQAWGIIAIDDEDLRGPTSNIISSMIVNKRQLVDCPIEKATKLPVVAEGSSSVVGLAVGIPIATIGAVIGLVMLFGQFRKHKRKKELEKQRKAEESDEYGSGPVPTERGRWAFTRPNKTAPVSRPNV